MAYRAYWLDLWCVLLELNEGGLTMVTLQRGALVSLGEAGTNRILRRYFSGTSYVIHKDTAVRQVIEVDRSELNAGEWSYYTKAAFDFVVCADDDTQPYELVIEYDGRQHDRPSQARKDKLKNRLCQQAGLPILRIGVEDIKPRDKTTILDFMLNQYFGEKQMSDLREKGRVAWDDEFFTTFPGTVAIQERLAERGLYPPLSYVARRDSQPSDLHWWRVTHQDAGKKRPPGSAAQYHVATVAVDVITGSHFDAPVLCAERTACFREWNPRQNVMGVHGWHIASELATYLCFRRLEGLWRRHLDSASQNPSTGK